MPNFTNHTDNNEIKIGYGTLPSYITKINNLFLELSVTIYETKLK